MTSVNVPGVAQAQEQFHQEGKWKWKYKTTHELCDKISNQNTSFPLKESAKGETLKQRSLRTAVNPFQVVAVCNIADFFYYF